MWISLLISGHLHPNQNLLPRTPPNHLSRCTHRSADSFQYQSVQSLISEVSQPALLTHTGQRHTQDGRIYVRQSWEERVMGLAALQDYLCSISADNWAMTTEIESIKVHKR